MKRVLPAALAASSLLLAPLSAQAGSGSSHPAAQALPVIQVAGREDDDKALAIIGALVGAALVERAVRENGAAAEEPSGASGSLPPIAALLGLALLERATRDDRDAAEETRGATAAPAEIMVPRSPEAAIGSLTLRAVPARPAWIEAMAAAQAPTSRPDEEPSFSLPPPPPLAEEVRSPARPPAPLAGVEPSFSPPPPPRLGEDLSDSATDDFGEVFGRAAETGATGY